jgi:hypothetical protein
MSRFVQNDRRARMADFAVARGKRMERVGVK